MFRSASVRIAVITVAVLVGLGLLHKKPWQRSGAANLAGAAPAAGGVEGARQHLTVGFLPVT